MMEQPYKTSIRKRVLALVVVMFNIPPAAWFVTILASGLVSWPEWKLLLIQGGTGWIPYVIIYNIVMWQLASRWLAPIEDVLQGRDVSEKRKEEARKSIYYFPLRLFVAEVLYAAYGGYSALTGVWLLTGQAPPMMDKRFLTVEFSSQAVIMFTAIPFLFIVARTINSALEATGLSKKRKGFNLERQFLIGNFGLAALAVLAISLFYYGRIRHFGIADAVFIAAVVWISYFFNRVIIKSILGVIQRMLSRIESIGKGDLTQRVEIASADEFGELAAAFNEMTESLRISRAGLEKAKAYSEGILSTMIDGLDVIDTNGICTDMNAYLLNLLGYKKEEMIGKFAPIITPERELEKGKWLIEETLTKGAVRDFELTLLTKTKEEIPAMFNTMWLKDEQGRVSGAFAVIRDMRGTKKLIKELEEAKTGLETKVNERTKELQQVNDKLRTIDEAKSQFVSIAAHQLRTPLSAIKWTFSMLLSGDFGVLRSHQKSAVERARESVDRIIALISDLLNVARIESGQLIYKFEPIQIEETVGGVVEETLPKAKEKNVILQLRKPDHALGEARGDKDKLRLVFQNLLDNAVLYSALEKGRVEIALRAKDDTHYEVVFSDNGIGIPQHQLSLLFQKFFRADNAMRSQSVGTGLGLYIASRIVEAHGGTIKVESEENKGSTFVVTLPFLV